MQQDLGLTRSIAYGQHVYVFSDFDLTPTTDPAAAALTNFVTFLRELDDAALVVVAGNFFDFGEADPVTAVSDTLHAHPALVSAIRSFCSQPHHELVILPGTHDHALVEPVVADPLVAFGITFASAVQLTIHAAEGERHVSIVVGSPAAIDPTTDSAVVHSHLDDALALPRFVTSRMLYRRYGAALWLGLLAVIGLDLFTTATKAIGALTHHHYVVHAPHASSLAGNVILNLLLVIVLEAAIVTLVAVAVRRRFRWRTVDNTSVYSEPLALTRIDSQNALDFARETLSPSVIGVIVGGATRPALAYFANGFCATPGPSRLVTTEREALLGLPSVFSTVERFAMVEIEAGADVRVRLVGQQTAARGSTILERLLGRGPVQPGLPAVATVVGSWPAGSPYPLNPQRLGEARRQRTVRRVAASLLLLDGLINVVVTTSPPLRERLSHVVHYLPLGAAQSAAAITAVAGVALVMLARGVRRGQRRAWYFAVTTLGLTIVTHIARAGSFGSSVVAAIIFGYLIVNRNHFAALTDRTSLRAALPRALGSALIAVATASFSMEVVARYNHLYVLPSWPTVVMACVERLVGIYVIFLPDRLSDFIDPALLAIGLSLVVALSYLATRPVVDRRLSQHGSSAERRLADLRARDIVRRHGRGTLDYFALRDDKQFFFFRDSLVAYAVYGGVALIAPDPIGPEAERSEVFSAFRSFAESRGWSIGVMAASAEWLPLYHAAGFHSLYLGDEAIVDCPTFSLEGGKMKGLRQACTRLARHGYSVEFYDPSTIDPGEIMGVLDLVAMMRRGDDERGFSMGLGRLFDPKDKGLLLTLVRGSDGRPAAACQFVPSVAIKGYSLDLMRRDPGEHPNGLIDYALCSTIAHLAAQGSQGLSLNFAAFRGVLDGERGEGTWTRIERWTLHRLSGALPIASLWTFNAKYHPRWLPRHIVYPALENFVPVVSAILRAESITEFPLLGKWLANDPANRPGTVVPSEVLAAAQQAAETP